MSIDYAIIKDALSLWGRTNTGLAYAIWADQDSPQPYDTQELKNTNAYITLRVPLDEQIAEDHVGPPNNNGIATISGNREFMLFIQIKGKNAIIEMNKLRDSFQKITVQNVLRASKIIYVDNFPNQNITGLDDTQFIERASMDVLLRTMSEITDDIGFINKVDVTGTVKDVKGGTVYQETFRVE